MSQKVLFFVLFVGDIIHMIYLFIQETGVQLVYFLTFKFSFHSQFAEL